MRNPTYLFEIKDKKGNTLRRCKRRCTNIAAREHASGLLSSIPDAAAVYGSEIHGLQVHAAYRQ